jgi:hypothetical protein
LLKELKSVSLGTLFWKHCFFDERQSIVVEIIVSAYALIYNLNLELGFGIPPLGATFQLLQPLSKLAQIDVAEEVTVWSFKPNRILGRPQDSFQMLGLLLDFNAHKEPDVLVPSIKL